MRHHAHSITREKDRNSIEAALFLLVANDVPALGTQGEDFLARFREVGGGVLGGTLPCVAV